jgi:arylsulfatase A
MRLVLFLLFALVMPSYARRPNIIFILADDLGYGDLGCYGQKMIRTPHLDRLAAEGLRFTQHYAGNAVCAPSRCVLMTGKHPGHADIRDNKQQHPGPLKVSGMPDKEGQMPLLSDTVILPMLLKQLGYKTGGFGKWGLGAPDTDAAPLKRGFDRWFGFNCQAVAHNYYPSYLWDDDQRVPTRNAAFTAHDKLKEGEDKDSPASYARFSGQDYAPDLITEQALLFAKQHRDEPFFLFWPTTVPHVALQVPADSLAEYQGKLPDEPYVGDKGYSPHMSPRAAYAAMITRMDRDVGRMVSLIQELGLEQDTLFVFTSDNGPLSGELQGAGGSDAKFFDSGVSRRAGKGSLYEAGVRVPCLVRWKGVVPAGRVEERVTGFEDWLPTLLELCEGKESAPAGVDGVSFAPTLRGQAQPERGFLYREFPAKQGQQSVRVGQWKAIRPRLKKDQTTELYDLAKDPAEETNVAGQHPEILAKLEALMQEQHQANQRFALPGVD